MTKYDHLQRFTWPREIHPVCLVKFQLRPLYLNQHWVIGSLWRVPIGAWSNECLRARFPFRWLIPSFTYVFCPFQIWLECRTTLMVTSNTLAISVVNLQQKDHHQHHKHDAQHGRHTGEEIHIFTMVSTVTVPQTFPQLVHFNCRIPLEDLRWMSVLIRILKILEYCSTGACWLMSYSKHIPFWRPW